MFANVQDDYNLRIIDFGLAEQLEENTDHVVNIVPTLKAAVVRGTRKYSPSKFWKSDYFYNLLYNYDLDNVYVWDPRVHVTRGDGL